MDQPKYSRELIERYRAQNFKRNVTERVPLDLEYDEVTLSCGHKKQMDVHLIEASDHKLTCERCRDEWLRKAVEDEKRGR